MIRLAGSFSAVPLVRRSYGGVRALGVLTVAMAVLIGCSSALAAASPRPPAASYLFSIPTASGSLTGPNDQHLTLRLTGTRDYLTRFTDRPLRQAFVVANVDFAKRFKGYFADSKPNAVLTYTPHGSQIPVSIVLTIGQPRWNAERSTWTFPAIRIRKQPDNLPGSHLKPPFIPNPSSFNQATLFIDDSTQVINGCIIQPDTVCPAANLAGSPYLRGANLYGAILSHADLSHADLFGVYLTNADLSYANLTYADPTYANLARANLTGADLTYAIASYSNLFHANLTGANLGGANLTGSDLTGATLIGANLTGSDLTGATLTGATFCQTTMPNGTINNSSCPGDVPRASQPALGKRTAPDDPFGDRPVAPDHGRSPHRLASARSPQTSRRG